MKDDRDAARQQEFEKMGFVNNNEGQWIYTRADAIRDGVVFPIEFSPPPGARFDLGHTVVSSGVYGSGIAGADEVAVALQAHAKGDWGRICEDDAELNDAQVRDERCTFLMSVWDGSTGEFWIITDGDGTTVLFPNEY